MTDSSTQPDSPDKTVAAEEATPEKTPANGETNEADDSELLSDRYRIDELLGEGAMGRVFRGEHVLMEKTVAIKVLHTEMLDNDEIVARFRREARAAAALQHPNVCQATDFGRRDDGSFFLVMEHLEGKTLQKLLADQNRLDPDRACSIARQIASALAEAHAEGIVHRDLKPENVMIVDRADETDTVKIMDFGIARLLATTRDDEDQQQDQTRLTREGMVYGTPHYMSPEQVAGDDVDATTDLYALGAVLFEMLAGRPPYDGDNIARVMGKHVTEPIPDLTDHRSDLASPLVELVEDLLAKEIEERPADADEVIDHIDKIDDETTRDGTDITRRIDDVVDRARTEGQRAADKIGPEIEKAGEKIGPLAKRSFSTARDVGDKLGPLAKKSLSTARKAGEKLGPVAKKSLSTATIAARKAGRHARTGATTALSRVRKTGRTLLEFWNDLPTFERRVVAGLSVAFLVMIGIVGITLSVLFSGDRQAAAVEDQRQQLLEDQEIAEAIDRAESGDRSTLSELLETRRDDPHLRYLALQADLAAHRSVDLLEEASTILELDGRYAHDPELIEGLVDQLADGNGDEVRELLADHFSSTIRDELAERARISSRSSMRDAAYQFLDQQDQLGALDDWQRVTAEMRQTSGCQNLAEKLERIRTIGDPRAISTLEAYQAKSTRGCGTLRLSDCYGCIRGDLQDVIDELSDD